VVLVAIGVAPVGATATGPTGGGLVELAADRWSGGFQVLEAPIVIEGVDESVDVTDPELVAEVEEVHLAFEPSNQVPAGAEAIGELLASSNGGITVNFSAGTPADVQSVFFAAVAEWDAALATNPSGPINIAVNWAPLSGSVLGSAGPNGLFRSGQMPRSDSYYPAALANTLTGTDVNDVYFGPNSPEINVTLNSNLDWYVGTTGSPGGKPDLFSVILHEVAHGLGFLGSASENNCDATSGNPTLESAVCSSYPFVYDQLVTYNGIPLLSDSNPSAHLESGNLRILLSDAYDTKVYAPAAWSEGSSFSHFDEGYSPAGSAGALMTPVLDYNSTERDLDAAVLGVMAGIGWPLAVGPITPTITGTSASGSNLSASWAFDLRQYGSAPDEVRLEAWSGSSMVGSTTVAASAGTASIGGLGCGSYVLRAVPLRDGVLGYGGSATIDISVPTAPNAVAVSGSGLTRTISWNASTGCGGGATYHLERSTDGIGWTPVGTTTGLSLTATVSEAIHQFRVKAVNGWGTSGYGYSIPVGIGAGIVRPVWLDGQVSRLYQAYFLRQPDGGGFNYWLDQRSGGVALETVSSAFAGSSEFQASYGALDDTHFLFLVYSNVLGRQPDLDGFNYWMAQLAAGASRGQVMIGFSESDEFINRTGTYGRQSVNEAEVYRQYVAAFLRFPDPAGYLYWVTARNNGTSLESMAAEFIVSAEFVERYGSLPDDEFVRLVYLNVLSREPDAGGLAYWVGQLGAGTSRASLLVGFAQSQEFIRATGTIR
jgi:hypothetical protein